MNKKLKYILIALMIIVLAYKFILKNDKIAFGNSINEKILIPEQKSIEIEYLKSFYNFIIADDFIQINDYYDFDLKELNDEFLKQIKGYSYKTGTIPKSLIYDFKIIQDNIEGIESDMYVESKITFDIVKKGDKSKNVEILQGIMSFFLDKEYKNKGSYDAETYNDVLMMFTGTSFLIEKKIGAIDLSKLKQLETLLINIINLKNEQIK